MSRWKVYAAAAIFLALTAVKLLSPSLAVQLREAVLPVLSSSVDYRSAMAELGEAVAGGEGSFQQALRYLMGAGEEAESAESTQAPESVQTAADKAAFAPMTLENVRTVLSAGLPVADMDAIHAAAEAEQEPAPEETVPEETPEAETEEVPAVVAAFLESQSAFSDYAVPANVSYSMPELPFSYVLPVASAAASSGFGYRLHPIQNVVKFHYGTDISAWNGEEICAFADGTVWATGEDPEGYGLYVIVGHAEGYRTLYAHCSEILVTQGQTVAAGDTIALAGETGLATGPHLHFELMEGETYLNPEFYLAGL